MEKPNKIHQNSKAVKRIFKYLKRTTKWYLFFNWTEDNHIKTFTDADYTGDIETRKSTTIKIRQFCNCLSIQQRTVVLSTEAEYIAASQTVRDHMDEKSDQLWFSYVQESYNDFLHG